jgi:adenosylcobinamide-phosphate synthase
MLSPFFFELALQQHKGFILALALIIAFIVDSLWGEPHFRIHPVVWMGNYLKKLGTFIAPLSPETSKPTKIKHLIYGGLAWGLGAVMVGLTALILDYFVFQLPWYWEALVLGILLKPLFAARMLFQEVQAVEEALTQSLQAGQKRISWLCSRDVTQLDASQVRETAIETLAENLNDSVIAPIFWFFVLGLPGVAIYRFANTADAMWGYIGMRSGQHWTWAGKVAAHTDDVLSWIPARLTALLIVVLGGGVELKKLYQQAQITPSPNGGWPMGAMALVLNISLGKPGVYRLNPSAPAPLHEHLQSAVLLSQKVVLLMLVIASFSLVMKDYTIEALFIWIGLQS